jgi:hypothetical protein
MRSCMIQSQFDRINGIDLQAPTSRKECDWKTDGRSHRPPDDG